MRQCPEVMIYNLLFLVRTHLRLEEEIDVGFLPKEGLAPNDERPL
jgi:hypothetical protein